MIRRSYAHRINRVKSVLGGLAAHAEKLAKWGVTQELTTRMNTLYDQACVTEQRRNALKADSQLATADQDQIMAELESNCGMIKKLIRFELPKEYWPEFGFRESEYAKKKHPLPEEPETPTDQAI